MPNPNTPQSLEICWKCGETMTRIATADFPSSIVSKPFCQNHCPTVDEEIKSIARYLGSNEEESVTEYMKLIKQYAHFAAEAVRKAVEEEYKKRPVVIGSKMQTKILSQQECYELSIDAASSAADRFAVGK